MFLRRRLTDPRRLRDARSSEPEVRRVRGFHALGVGFGTDVRFDLYVTVFYVEAAPAGYSLLNQ